jgi:HYDIN/CFA65/VesB-like, Ig-like domain/PQQ-like domain
MRGGGGGWLVVLGLCFGCGTPVPGESSGPKPQSPVSRGAAASVEAASDGLRTGWYPEQPALAPARVSAPDFGQLFDTSIDGEVHAQPLVANGRLLVVTEKNAVYSLDPASGAIAAQRSLHVPWKPADLNCTPLEPNIGIMGTPAVDTTSNTAYFFAKTYASGSSGPAAYWAHAVDLATLAERPGFPVRIQGSAANTPGVTFDATYQLQRAGLLFLDGIVYAAFAGICDVTPFRGWLVGIAGDGRITTIWAAEPALSNGAGIWQTGGAPVTDGPGTFIVSTGNGPVPSVPTPGTQPPAVLGEAWVRLRVQGDGTLRATDFFTPYDGAKLNDWDGDFGSGGPMGLPDSLGTSQFPHLAVATGKQGYVYLLDRDHLGGFKQGPGGADDVLQRLGPYGGVWSKPSVWPAGGGWLYIPTASNGGTPGGVSGTLDVYRVGVDGSGNPTLARVAQAAGAFGLGTSAPVVTSDGTTPGSALVWLIWSANNTGIGAQLRAYDAVPLGTQFNLRYSAPIGQATKYTPPGIAGGRVYVATRDGHLRAFGSPVDPVLTAPPVDFGMVSLNTSVSKDVVFTAQRAVTVHDVWTGAPFSVKGTVPALPVALTAGQTVTVSVSFTPFQSGPLAAALVADTEQGPFSTSLTGTGRSTVGELQSAPQSLSLGGTAVGRTISGAVTLTNVGGAPLTILSVSAPTVPFSATGLPSAGQVLATDQSVTVTVSFAPTEVGEFIDQLVVTADVGPPLPIPMSATSGLVGNLEISPRDHDFGQVKLGQSARRSFTISNTGGSRITVNKSQPPGGAVGFAAVVDLPEGSTLDPGASQTLEVTFTPRKAGSVEDRWVLTADDDQGLQEVHFRGSGAGDGCSSAGGLWPWCAVLLLPWTWRRCRRSRQEARRQ